MGRKIKVPAPPGFIGCARCLTIKPEADFYFYKSRNRRDSYCKTCKNLGTWSREKTPRADRFWPKVDKNGPVFQNLGPCWLWTGAKRDYGYGNFSILENGKFRCVRAYRVAWELTGHELPVKPYVLDHICKNPPCVNPDHLRVVTQHFNTTVNSDAPHGINSRRVDCINGHPLSGANLAMYPTKNRTKVSRSCLTCAPERWRYAVVQRDPPPGSRFTWLGPFLP